MYSVSKQLANFIPVCLFLQDVQLLGLKQHAESIAQERDRLRQERDAFASQLERKNLDMQHRSQVRQMSIVSYQENSYFNTRKKAA